MTGKFSRTTFLFLFIVAAFAGFSRAGLAATSVFTTSLTGGDRFDSLPAAEAAMRASGAQAASLEFDSVQSETGLGIVRLYSLPPIEPVAGPWQYGNNRCARIQWGFATEEDAVNAGMARFYNHCGDPSVDDPGYWGTPQRKTRGSCGSTQRYPKYTNGIERINTRQYKIRYCGSLREGLTIYRSRQVTGCPDGYSPAPDRLMCISGFTSTITETFNRKNSGCSSHSLGNPCDPATGNKYQSETDFRLKELSFVRSYNSGEPEDVGLGKGWTSNLHKRLVRSGSRLSPIEQDGRAFIWTRSSDVWQSDEDVPYTLSEDQSGFWITRDDGRKEWYDLDGRLQEEISPSGRTSSYEYDGAGRLASVATHFGSSIVFSYDSRGRIATVTTPAGESYQYQYDANDNLIRVEYPDGTQRNYHYEDPNFPNHLTGITDENANRYATFSYDSRGRAIGTEHAVTDNGSAQEKYIFDYQE